MFMAGTGNGGFGHQQGPGSSGTCNPRKFSEKIALLTQRQAEDTAAFQEVMMDITSTRRARQARSQGVYYGGSLPNVNQIGRNISDVQGPPTCAPDSGFLTRRRPDPVQGDRQLSVPVRPIRRHMDSAPYRPVHLSPPAELCWKSGWPDSSHMNTSQHVQPPMTALNRTNSDSALHTSVRNTHTGNLLSPTHRTRHRMFPYPVPPIEENVLEEGKPPRCSRKSAADHNKSCEIPGINVLSAPGQQLSALLDLPAALSASGSLPDLSSLHLPSPQPGGTSMDSDVLSGSLSTACSTGHLPGTTSDLKDLGIREDQFHLPGLCLSLQGSLSNPLLPSSLSHPSIQTSLSSHSLPNSLNSASLHLSLSNPSLQSSPSNQSLQSFLSNSSLSGQSIQSAASYSSYSSGIGGSRSCSSSSLSGSPRPNGQSGSRRRTPLSPLVMPPGGETRWHQAKQFSPVGSPTLSSITQGVLLHTSGQTPKEQSHPSHPPGHPPGEGSMLLQQLSEGQQQQTSLELQTQPGQHQDTPRHCPQQQRQQQHHHQLPQKHDLHSQQHHFQQQQQQKHQQRQPPVYPYPYQQVQMDRQDLLSQQHNNHQRLYLQHQQHQQAQAQSYQHFQPPQQHRVHSGPNPQQNHHPHPHPNPQQLQQNQHPQAQPNPQPNQHPHPQPNPQQPHQNQHPHSQPNSQPPQQNQNQTMGRDWAQQRKQPQSSDAASQGVLLHTSGQAPKEQGQPSHPPGHAPGHRPGHPPGEGSMLLQQLSEGQEQQTSLELQTQPAQHQDKPRHCPQQQRQQQHHHQLPQKHDLHSQQRQTQAYPYPYQQVQIDRQDLSSQQHLHHQRFYLQQQQAQAQSYQHVQPPQYQRVHSDPNKHPHPQPNLQQPQQSQQPHSQPNHQPPQQNHSQQPHIHPLPQHPHPPPPSVYQRLHSAQEPEAPHPQPKQIQHGGQYPQQQLTDQRWLSKQHPYPPFQGVDLPTLQNVPQPAVPNGEVGQRQQQNQNQAVGRGWTQQKKQLQTSDAASQSPSILDPLQQGYTGLCLTPSQTEALSQQLGQLSKEPPWGELSLQEPGSRTGPGKDLFSFEDPAYHDFSGSLPILGFEDDPFSLDSPLQIDPLDLEELNMLAGDQVMEETGIGLCSPLLR